MTNQPLGISEILKKAFAVYRKNIGALIKFALVNVLYTLFLNVGTYLMELGQGKIDLDALLGTQTTPGLIETTTAEELPAMLAESGWMSAMAFMGMGLLLMAVYVVLSITLIPRNQLGMQFYMAGVMAGESSTPPLTAEEKPRSILKSAYEKTKGKVSGYVGSSILLGLILVACIIPLMLVLVPIFLFSQSDPSVPVMVAAVVPVIILALAVIGPWYILLAPAAAFMNGGSLLSQISRIKKGNHWRVLVISLAAMLPSSIAGVLTLTNLHALVVAAISAAVSLFAFGFSGAAQLLTYQRLVAKHEPENWELVSSQPTVALPLSPNEGDSAAS